MAARSEEFRKQVNELWKQAVDQLEEVKETVLKSTERFEADVHRMRLERDRLLKKLGEQTHRLATDGKLPVPVMVKRTVDRLNEVIDGIVAQEGGKKKSRKKTSKKKSSSKKKAAKKKTATRKATKKKSS